MKKIILTILLIAFIGDFVLAAAPCCDKITVTVRGEGSTNVKPNLAIITVSLTQDAKTSK